MIPIILLLVSGAIILIAFNAGAVRLSKDSSLRMNDERRAMLIQEDRSQSLTDGIES